MQRIKTRLLKNKNLSSLFKLKKLFVWKKEMVRGNEGEKTRKKNQEEDEKKGQSVIQRTFSLGRHGHRVKSHLTCLLLIQHRVSTTRVLVPFFLKDRG